MSAEAVANRMGSDLWDFLCTAKVELIICFTYHVQASVAYISIRTCILTLEMDGTEISIHDEAPGVCERIRIGLPIGWEVDSRLRTCNTEK
jgi:hypothetical protein